MQVETATDTPASRGSAAERIASQLEEDIVLGRLPPCARLIEQELADRFATHRAAIRLALFELEKKGIIERTPNRGAMVRDLKPEEVRQIYAVRENLELMAARTIPLPIDTRSLDDLAALQEVHGRAARERNLRTVFRTNLEFHRRMFGLCGNPFLIDGIEHFAQKAYGIRFFSNAYPDYLARVCEDHLGMIEALRKGNREELIRLCQRHLQPSLEAYVRAYDARFPVTSDQEEVMR